MKCEKCGQSIPFPCGEQQAETVMGHTTFQQVKTGRETLEEKISTLRRLVASLEALSRSMPVELSRQSDDAFASLVEAAFGKEILS